MATAATSPSKGKGGTDHAEHRDENQLAQTFKQLNLAHETSVMVYNKSGGDSHTKDLVRKYRPEFGEIYVFNDAKSCFSFIEAHNNDADHQKISLILLEADAVSLKILDFLSKRAVNRETSALPLIASVVLVPETADDDVLRAIDGAGGANALVRLPASSAQILNTMLDVLYRRRLVENMYTDLKVINQESRYPFLPIFVQEKPSLDRQAALKMKDSANANRMAATTSSGDGEDSGMNYIVSKNNDDWTECSSILPTFVKKFRAKEKGKGHPWSTGSAPTLTQMIKLSPAELLERAATDRFTADAAIYSKLKEAAATVDDDEEAARFFDGDFLAHGSEKDLRESETGAGVDGGLCDEDLSSEGSDSEGEEQDDVFKDDMQSLTGAPKGDTVRLLLDPSRRPKWGHGNVTAHGGSSASSQVSAASATMLELEMKPFVERPVPNIAHKRTVGGIDKDVADKCWKVLLNKGMVSVETGIDARRDAKDDIMEDLRSHPSSAASTPRVGGTGTNKPFAEAASSQAMTHAVDTLASVRALEEIDVDNLSPQMSRGGHMRPTTSGSLVTNESKPTIMFPAAVSRATRTLKRATKKVPRDVFVHNLLDVEMHNRKINMGDRELFERGLRHEAANEDDSAIACYVRARKTSKDPQLPRMFLGAVYFKKGLYLAALKQYDAALRTIGESRGMQYSPQDDFVANYNRAVTYFRLGEDACGVDDLARAVALRPQHMGAKRLMALVQRRMGNFDEAITNTVEMEAMRTKIKNDELQKRHEEEEAQEKREMELRRQRELMASRGSPSAAQRALTQASVKGTVGGVPETDADTEATGSMSALKSARTGAGAGGVGLPKINESPSGERIPLRVGRSSVVGIGEGSMASAGGSTAASQAHSQAARRKKGHPDLVHQVVTIREREDTSLAARAAKALSAYHVEKGGFDALNTFKATNGYKLSLFESLFIRPSPLQEALGCRPKLRTQEQIDLIMTTLRLFPFLRRVSDDHLLKLSAVIEYRAVSTPSQLLSQNSSSDAAVFLLRGTVEMRMEKPVHISSAEDTIVGHVGEFSVFGHTDFLFRDERTEFYNDLMTMLALEKISLNKVEKKQEEAESHDHDDHGPGHHTHHGHHGDMGNSRRGSMIHGHSRHGSMIHGHHADMNRSRSGGSIMHSMHGPSRHGNAAHGHHNLGTSGRATDQFSVLAAAGRKLEEGNVRDLDLAGHRRNSSLLLYGMSSSARRMSVAMETARANGEDMKQFMPAETNHAAAALGIDADLVGGDHDMATMQVLAAAKRRAVAPGMFLTYTMVSPCELLVVGD